MSDYQDLGEQSNRVEQWWAERDGHVWAAAHTSSMVNEFPYKGQTLVVTVTLSGERKVGFEQTYDYEWLVLLKGTEKLPALKDQRLEVEAAVAEDRGVFKDWSPKDKVVSGPSASVGVGLPAVGSVSFGGSRGSVARVNARRLDLNRVHWEFKNIHLDKEAGWRAVAEGNVKVFTMPKPFYSGIGKVPEFFPIRFTIRLAFRGRRRMTTAYLSTETVVCMPSVVFLLNREWSKEEEGIRRDAHLQLHGM